MRGYRIGFSFLPIANAVIDGTKILSETTGYWRASSNTFTLVSPGAIPSPSLWTKINCSVSTGVADPDGGTNAVTIVENAATGVHAVALGNLANVAGGWIRFSAKIKVIDVNTSGYRFEPRADRGGWSWVLNATNEATNGFSAAYVTTGNNNRMDGFKWRDIGDGWREVSIETSLTATSSDTGWFRDPQNRAGKNGPSMTVYAPRIEQDRVVAWTGKSNISLIQSANDARPVLAPVWLGSRRAVCDSYPTASELQSGGLALGTICTVAFVVGTKSPRPSTDQTIAKISGLIGSLEIQIASGGTWKVTHTSDEGAITVCASTRAVSPFPVHLCVVQDLGFVRVFVDGVIISETAIASQATINWLYLQGGESVYEQAAVWSRALDAASVAAVCSVQRADAGLPAKWPIYVISGQSNATSAVSKPQDAANSGLRQILGWAERSKDYQGTNIPWVPGFPCRAELSTTAHGLYNGVIYELQKRGMLGGVLSMARGGTDISAWLAGGILRTHVEDELALTEASLGTHLFEYAAWLWVQGEADSNNATLGPQYLPNVENVRLWVRSKLGEVPFVIHRLNSGIPDVTAPYGANVRAAQDEMAVRYPDVKISRLDGLNHLVDNWHYNPKSLQAAGRNMIRAMIGASLLTAWGEDP